MTGIGVKQGAAAVAGVSRAIKLEDIEIVARCSQGSDGLVIELAR